MASILAIISKSAFEKSHRGAKVGDVLAIDAYTTAHKAFAPLRHGGALFLVTVRPGAKLWLVAILEAPFFEDGAWRAQLNEAPVTDITARVPGLVFENGQGISGALAQALQTPRVLTEADEKLLREGGVPVTAEQTEADLVDLMIDGDEAARVVYMDWLLERGDPRGMAMRNEVEKPSERDQQLALGPLFKVTASRIWRRGLLESFELRREEAADGDTWQRAAESPWLRTVKRIERGPAKPPRYRTFVTSPLAQSLEEATAANAAALQRLLAQPRRALRTLTLDKPTPAMRETLEETQALPRLAQIVLRTREPDIDEVVSDWLGASIGKAVVMPTAPFHFDWQDTKIREQLVRWLAAMPAVAERRYKRWWSVFRTRKIAAGTELEITTDDFSVEEVLMTESIKPAKLVLQPRGEIDTTGHLTELLDNANSWWLGDAVRKLFEKLGAAKLELRGDYERLWPLVKSK